MGGKNQVGQEKTNTFAAMSYSPTKKNRNYQPHVEVSAPSCLPWKSTQTHTHTYTQAHSKSLTPSSKFLRAHTHTQTRMHHTHTHKHTYTYTHLIRITSLSTSQYNHFSLKWHTRVHTRAHTHTWQVSTPSWSFKDFACLWNYARTLTHMHKYKLCAHFASVHSLSKCLCVISLWNNAHVHAHAHARTHACTHAHTHPSQMSSTRWYFFAIDCLWNNTHIHTNTLRRCSLPWFFSETTPTHIHTHTHTHINTHTHTHTHTHTLHKCLILVVIPPLCVSGKSHTHTHTHLLSLSHTRTHIHTAQVFTSCQNFSAVDSLWHNTEKHTRTHPHTQQSPFASVTPLPEFLHQCISTWNTTHVHTCMHECMYIHMRICTCLSCIYTLEKVCRRFFYSWASFPLALNRDWWLQFSSV